MQNQHLHPQLPPPGIGFGNPHPGPGDWHNGFVDRMGELLQLREAQRQRQRAIRRREQQALEEFQIHRIATGNEPNAAHVQPPHILNREQNVHQAASVQAIGASAAGTGYPLHRKDNRLGLGPAGEMVPQPQHPNRNTQTHLPSTTNSLLVPPRLPMHDQHYAYHQRIQRHLNPVPAPIPPPPSIGGHRGNGPPPPAHPVIPHTVALPPLPAVTSNILPLIRPPIQPPPAHPQRGQYPKPVINATAGTSSSRQQPQKTKQLKPNSQEPSEQPSSSSSSFGLGPSRSRANSDDSKRTGRSIPGSSARATTMVPARQTSNKLN